MHYGNILLYYRYILVEMDNIFSKTINNPEFVFLKTNYCNSDLYLFSPGVQFSVYILLSIAVSEEFLISSKLRRFLLHVMPNELNKQ